MKGSTETCDVAGRYWLSMDRRLAASRFIVVAYPTPWQRLQSLFGRHARPNLVAQGLVEDAVPAFATSARVVFDDPAQEVPGLSQAIAVRWLRMQQELKVELRRRIDVDIRRRQS